MASSYLLICMCVGIHLGRVEQASPIELTTPRTEALQARWSCASSLETFTQSFLHRAWPRTRGPEIFSWPPVRLRTVRGGVGLDCFTVWTSCSMTGTLVRRRGSFAFGTQSLRLTYRMRWMLLLSKTFNTLSSVTRTSHVSQHCPVDPAL